MPVNIKWTFHSWFFQRPRQRLAPAAESTPAKTAGLHPGLVSIVSMQTTPFFLAALPLLALAFLPSAFAGETILQDDSWTAAFDNDSGALTGLEKQTTHSTIEPRPALGLSFRLHAPLAGRRDNFVLGEKQRRPGQDDF